MFLVLSNCGINSVIAEKLKLEKNVLLCLSKSLIFLFKKKTEVKTHACLCARTRTHTPHMNVVKAQHNVKGFRWQLLSEILRTVTL